MARNKVPSHSNREIRELSSPRGNNKVHRNCNRTNQRKQRNNQQFKLITPSINHTPTPMSGNCIRED